MNWLLWNIRGIHQQHNTDHLKVLLQQNSIQLLMILEPKATQSEISRFAFSMDFPNSYHGSDMNTYIWILWKQEVYVTPLHISPQAITVHILMPNNRDCITSWVYAKCLSRIRVQLWDHLLHISNNFQIPWMVCGDFNKILSLSEKIGGRKEDTT